MSTDRIPENARAVSDRDDRSFDNADRQVLLAERIEAELDRLRRARPHLTSRLDRASQILLLQLSAPARQRPIRCRVSQDGRHRRALVRSSTDSGGVYVVQERDFACSCPDHHRAGPGCKHALACFVLSRVAQVGHARPRSERGCSHCTNGWVALGEDLVDSSSGEVVHAENLVRCQRCQPPLRGLLSASEMESWFREQRWIYAKTMPAHPHEYCLRSDQADEELWESVVATIWLRGYDRSYLHRPWRSLDISDHYVWVHTRPSRGTPPPTKITEVINRAPRGQARLVDMHSAE